MRTIEKTIYQFHELSDEAKSKALEKAREYVYQEPGDWDHVIDYAVDVGAWMGFDLMQRRTTLLDGKWNYAPSVFFSGFWSQGDGACFEATYSYGKNAKALIALNSGGTDKATLSALADRLQALQKSHFYSLRASVSHTGHYYHEYSMSYDLSCDCKRCQGYNPGAEAEEEFREICADFARWIYRTLKREYEYQSSDERLIEMIEANEYEFDEDGEMV